VTALEDAEEVKPTPSADPFQGLPLLITVPRAAAVLGISRAAAYRYAAAGDLPVKRLGGRIYIPTAGIQRIVSDLAS